MSKSENAPSDLTGALSLLGHAIAPVVRGLPRQTQVEEATQKLKSYCLQHFPRWKADFTVCQAGRSKFNTRHKLLTGWW